MKKGLLQAMLVAGGVACYSVLSTALYKKTEYVRTNCGSGIALTFDDGPHPIYTPQLLDLLKRYNIRATFFVVGAQAEKYPELVRRMYEEGHAIGVHHYRHTSNWLMLPHRVAKEISTCADIIERITGEYPILYRPPWGHLNAAVPFVAKSFSIVLWSIHFSDWRVARIKHSLTQQLFEASQDGAIFLLHDNGQTIGADEEAPKYMLLHLENYLKKYAHQFRFVKLGTPYE